VKCVCVCDPTRASFTRHAAKWRQCWSQEPLQVKNIIYITDRHYIHSTVYDSAPVGLAVHSEDSLLVLIPYRIANRAAASSHDPKSLERSGSNIQQLLGLKAAYVWSVSASERPANIEYECDLNVYIQDGLMDSYLANLNQYQRACLIAAPSCWLITIMCQNNGFVKNILEC
jgi:hypothetical protein